MQGRIPKGLKSRIVLDCEKMPQASFALYVCEGAYYFLDFGTLRAVASSQPVNNVWDTKKAISITAAQRDAMQKGDAIVEQPLSALSTSQSTICFLYDLGSNRKFYHEIQLWGTTGFTQGHGTVSIVSAFTGYTNSGPII